MQFRMGAPVRRMRRWGTALVVGLFMVAVPALSQDDDGPDFLTRSLQGLLSDAGRDVRIEGFRGALSSRATVDRISISDDFGVWITLDDVIIDWNRAALLQGVVDVNDMSAQVITIARLPGAAPVDALPSPTARAPFTLPDLPVSVLIDRIGAGRVDIDPAVSGQPISLTLDGAMRLEGGEGEARLDGTRIDGQQGVLRFAGSFDNETRLLDLDLTLEEAAGGLAATLLGVPGRPALGLVVRGRGPLATFRADVTASTDGQPRVSGFLTLIDESPNTTLLAGGGFGLDLRGDLRPFLGADLHPFFGDESTLLATGQRTEDGRTELSALRIQTNAARVEGSLTLDRQGVPVNADLDIDIRRPDAQPVILPGTEGAVRIDRGMLTLGYDSAVSRDWFLRAQIDALTTPTLASRRTALVGSGRLGASGSSAALFEGVLDFSSEGIVAQDPAVQDAIGTQIFGLASLTWPSADAPIAITGLGVESDTVSLTASGQIQGLTYDGFIEFAAPDLSVFSGLANRPLGGQALVSVQGMLNPVTGALDIETDLVGTDLRIDQPEVDALLSGVSQVSASLVRDTSGTTLRALSVETSVLALTAQGQFLPETALLDASLSVSDLSQLGEGYGGRLQTDVQITAAQGQTRVRADGVAIDIALGGVPDGDLVRAFLIGANRMQLDAVIDDAGLTLERLLVAGPAVTLEGQGLWGAERTDLAVTASRLDLAAAGGRGTLRAQARAQGTQGEITYEVGVTGAGPLRSGNALIDGLFGEGIDATATAQTLPDGSILLQSAQVQAAGLTVDAQGRVAADGAQEIRLAARLPQLSRFSPLVIGALTLDATLARASGSDWYQLDARAQGPSDLGLRVAGRIGGARDAALAFDGQIDGAALSPFVEPGNIAGQIAVSGRVDGPLALSSVRATVRARDARYVLPPANVAFEGISLDAQIAQSVADVALSGRSLTGGSAQVSGRIPLGAGAAHLDVSVADYVVRHPQLFDARINGQLAVDGVLTNSPLVSGTVQVAQTEIRIPSSALGRTAPQIAGLRHVGEDTATRATRLAAGIARGQRDGRRGGQLRLDLVLDAPGRVFVRGRGLDAELGGRLRLGGTTRAIVPSGEFSLIRGRLDLLGNRFTLTDGSASMLGSFIPFISLTATTENSGVLTSVTLSGEANAPAITFSSVPSLPEDEVLARLVFGRSLTQLSPFQAAQLGLSVATLTGRADNSVLSRTRTALGLDDLDFTVDEDGNTALRAGRYLTEQVYTDLSVDTAGRGEVSINLDLTDSVTLRGTADSDGGSSLGVFFERDY